MQITEIYIEPVDKHGKLGIAKLPPVYKLSLLRNEISIPEQKYIDELTSNTRKLERATAIWLSKQLAGDFSSIYYDEFKKPHFTQSNYYLSLSHTNNYVASFVHSEKRVGVDIEKIGNKALKVASKFLSPEEYKTLSKQLDKELYATIYWAAKEALYKLYGKKSLIFAKQIKVIGIGTNNFYGEILNNSELLKAKLYYKHWIDHAIVYAIEE
ncbi:MAG: 4'-phosphopantetheinyl transferase family protein [Bacteroidia bacterium]